MRSATIFTHERHLRIHRVVLEFDGQDREDFLDAPAISIDNVMHVLAPTERLLPVSLLDGATRCEGRRSAIETSL